MTPSLDFLLEAEVHAGPPVEIGDGRDGTRRMIPITGGRFEGPKLKGIILPGGADWQIVRSREVLELEARYVLETSDRVRLAVRNRGFRHGPEKVMARLARGERVPPEEYYFRTAARLEAPPGSYEWLNRFVMVGSGERRRDRVAIRLWIVG
jgi:hypothetical protein